MTREEAIERIKARFDKWALDDEDMKAIQTLIPELRESEGESIRKALIDALKVSETIGELKFRLPEPTREECIAYLEKQKEASKAIEAVDRIDKYIDENTTNAHDMKDSHPDKKYCQGIDNTLSDIAGILQDVYSEDDNKFAPQVLPCSAAWFEDGDENQKEHKPEWSEEDEKMINTLVSYVEDPSCWNLKCPREKLVAFIEYLPKRFSPQPKQEWGEEDSDNLERVDNYLWMLDDYVGDDCAISQGKTDEIRGNIQGLLSPWLKSLPERFNLQPKPGWSEENKEKGE
jgi:hypothetical protein